MRRTLALLALSVTLIGCRSSDSAHRKPDLASKAKAAMSAATALQQARQLCEALHVTPGRRVGACCGRPAPRYLFDECVRVLGDSLQTQSVQLDAQAVARCSRGAGQSFAGCDWVTPSQPLPPAACQGLVRGRVREGGRCRSSLECAAPLHCRDAKGGEPGRCRAPQATGASCVGGPDLLAAYLLERDVSRAHPLCADFCSPLSQRCAAKPAAGSACVSSVQCGPGQRCVAGQCAEGEQPARAAAGALCSTDLACAAGGCSRAADGQKRCGMKCSVSLPALDSRETKLALPGRLRR
jgi:hypothetical protein